MNARSLLQLAALTSTAFLGGTAIAADAGKTITQMQNNPSPSQQRSQGNTVAGPQSVGGSERMDNSNSATFDAWMSDYAAAHDGRVTRNDFLDQMGRRWDSIDSQRRGYLTPDEARGVYGQGARPARTGSDVQPGYTGPGNWKK